MYSICLECGEDVFFSSVFNDPVSGLPTFTCSSAKKVHDCTFEQFLSNLMLMQNPPCPVCTKSIELWQPLCGLCNTKIPNNYWEWYLAFELDVGPFARFQTYHLGRKYLSDITFEALNKAKKSDFRSAFDIQTMKLRESCFQCYRPMADCMCYSPLPIEYIEWIGEDILLEDFWFIMDEVGNKVNETCAGCKHMFSMTCPQIPRQMLTMNIAGIPKYKLDTCEYHDPTPNVNPMIIDYDVMDMLT